MATWAKLDEVYGLPSVSDIVRSARSETGNVLADIQDERMKQLWKEAMDTRSALPLLKEELKYRILTRRLSEGKDELQSPLEEPERCYELTEEERRKILQRRDRNRASATQHRQKRKAYVEELQERYKKAKRQNDKLQSEIRAFRTKLYPKIVAASIGSQHSSGRYVTSSSSMISTTDKPAVSASSLSPRQKADDQKVRSSVGSQTDTEITRPSKRKTTDVNETELSALSEHNYVKIRIIPQSVVFHLSESKSTTTLAKGVRTLDRKTYFYPTQVSAGANGSGEVTILVPSGTSQTALSTAEGSGNPTFAKSSCIHGCRLGTAVSQREKRATSTVATATLTSALAPVQVATSTTASRPAAKSVSPASAAAAAAAPPLSLDCTTTSTSLPTPAFFRGVQAVPGSNLAVIGVTLCPI